MDRGWIHVYKEKQKQLISPSRTDEMPAGFMNYFHYSISVDQLACASDHESVLGVFSQCKSRMFTALLP